MAAARAVPSGDDICFSHFYSRCSTTVEASIDLAKQLSLRGSSEASFLTLSPNVITTTGKAVQQGSQALQTLF